MPRCAFSISQVFHSPTYGAGSRGRSTVSPIGGRGEASSAPKAALYSAANRGPSCVCIRAFFCLSTRFSPRTTAKAAKKKRVRAMRKSFVRLQHSAVSSTIRTNERVSHPESLVYFCSCAENSASVQKFCCVFFSAIRNSSPNPRPNRLRDRTGARYSLRRRSRRLRRRQVRRPQGSTYRAAHRSVRRRSRTGVRSPP